MNVVLNIYLQQTNRKQLKRRKGSRRMEVKITVQDEENKETHINEYEKFAELLVDVVNKLDLSVSEVIIKKQVQPKAVPEKN